MIKRILLMILGLPKTIYFNFNYLPFWQAIKLPILVSHRVILRKLKGELQIIPEGRFALIKIGFGYVDIFDETRSRSIWECGGTVIFHGRADIGHGSKICVGQEGVLEMGDNFVITAESQIICFKNIVFGDNVLISWQCLVMDTDFHKILQDDKVINLNKRVVIGNKVWVGCRSTILKGTSIAEGTIIAANSNVVKSVAEKRCVIGGNPAKIINRGIDWNP